MLDLSTKIPAAVRPRLKALVRSHGAFASETERAFPGVPSRDLTRAQWIELANRLNLADEVRVMLADYATDPNAFAVDPELESGSDHFAPDETDETGDAPARVDLVTVDPVLDAIRGFLAPRIVDEVETLLRPIVELANKPPETITETVYIETATTPAGAPVSPIQPPRAPRQTAIELPKARKTGASTLGRVFGVRGKHASHAIGLWDAVDAPAPDPYYVPDHNRLALVATALERGRNVWLAGPAGSGKTTLPREIAAATKRPFVRIAFQRGVESFDFIGMKELDGAGGMVWTDGVLTKSMRRPGTVILLDELCFAPPGVAAMLQTVLDTKSLTLSTGEVVKCAEGVVFVVADNTAGFGDTSGVYAGTQMANGALVDRMARLVVVDYLDPELEAAALVNHTGVARPAADRLAAFVANVRKTQAAEGISSRPLSLRRLVAFVECVQDGFSVDEAFEVTMLSRLPDADRETLRQAIRAQFDQGAFRLELDGKTVSPVSPVSSDPAQTAARGAFDPVAGF